MISFTIKRHFKKFRMIILKSAVYVFVLLLIPYLYLAHQAKQGIDAFIVSYPLGGEVDYDWVTVNFDGDVYLHNVRFYQSSRDPVFTSHKIKIEFGSSFEIIDLKTKVVYKELPLNLTVNLEHASSEQMNLLPKLFGINYDPDFVNLFFPTSCEAVIVSSFPYITFEGRVNFEIQRTADIAKVDYYFRSKEVASLAGSFSVNNFSSVGDDNSFISHLRIKADDLAIVQQNTQKCLESAKLNRDQFSKALVNQMSNKANDSGLSINTNPSRMITEFMYIPQSIELIYSLEDGKTFSQIPTNPIDQYLSLTGLDIKLNDLSLGTIFSRIEKPKEIKRSTDGGFGEDQNLRDIENTIQTNIPVSYISLKNNIGSKLELHFKNGSKMVGYLEQVDQKEIVIRQLKFKGESILPFLLEEISKIQLLRKN